MQPNEREKEKKMYTTRFWLQCVNAIFFSVYSLSSLYDWIYMVQIHFLFDRIFFVFCSSAKQCMTNQRVYATAHGAHTLEHMRTKWESEKKKSVVDNVERGETHPPHLYCEYITLCYDERLIFFGWIYWNQME